MPPKAEDAHELLTIEESAALLGIPPTNLSEWIAGGLVPLPLRISHKVIRYQRPVVVAMGVLIGYGFLPLAPQGRKKR